MHQEVYTARLSRGSSEGILPTSLALPGSTLELRHVIRLLIVRLAGSRPLAQLASSALQTSPEDLLIAVRLPSGQS